MNEKAVRRAANDVAASMRKTAATYARGGFMTGSKSGSGLSVRAANVLGKLGIDDAKGRLVCLSELNHIAAVNCMSPDTFLRRQRNAGAVTRREILGWCGLPTDPALHVCTCRTCGKQYK